MLSSFLLLFFHFYYQNRCIISVIFATFFFRLFIGSAGISLWRHQFIYLSSRQEIICFMTRIVQTYALLRLLCYGMIWHKFLVLFDQNRAILWLTCSAHNKVKNWVENNRQLNRDYFSIYLKFLWTTVAFLLRNNLIV